MVSKGLAAATAFAAALSCAGAFAPGSAFVRQPLSPTSYGIERMVNLDGAVAKGVKVRLFFELCFLTVTLVNDMASDKNSFVLMSSLKTHYYRVCL